MDLASRKRNRLINYDYSQQGLYFITLCSEGKKNVFGSLAFDSTPSPITVGGDAHIDPPILGFNEYIRLSEHGKIADKYIRTIPGIDCYCIMPNHIHMIINLYRQSSLCTTASSGNIPQLIKSFKTLVTKEIGYSIWQRSYYDHIIRNYNDYQTRFNYIENNALNWINKYQP